MSSMQLQACSHGKLQVSYSFFEAAEQDRWCQYPTRATAPVSTSLPLAPPASGRPPPASSQLGYSNSVERTYLQLAGEVMTLGVVLSPCLKCRSSGLRPSGGRPRPVGGTTRRHL